MIKYWPWLLSIAAIFIFNIVLTIINWNDMRVLKDELSKPQRVELVSNGVVHSWPIDGKYNRIVKDEK